MGKAEVVYMEKIAAPQANRRSSWRYEHWLDNSNGDGLSSYLAFEWAAWKRFHRF